MDYRGLVSAAPVNNDDHCDGFCTHSGSNSHAGRMRVDLRLLGPADSTGAYQAWLEAVSVPNHENTAPFIVETADQRIQPSEATEPLNKPTYFKFTTEVPPANLMPTERGTYYWSNYWSTSRARDNRTAQMPVDGGGRTRRSQDLAVIPDHMLLAVEMDLLKAEALYYLGEEAEAATLINKSRVGNGVLPAVTVTGVPQSPSCVPKLYNGACGSLLVALMYEKRIETYGTAISFFDLRGWGCLLEGTLLELPPPGRQLDLLGKPIYSFGGLGGNRAAPKPTACPLLHKP